MKTANQELLKKFNEAFASSDTEYLLTQVTDDISWRVLGQAPIEGKAAFEKALREMASDEPLDLTIENIITHGKTAAVNGAMKSADGSTHVGFCDVYVFSGFKDPKIREMSSYAIDMNS